ncbi:MAG: hypothetical protein LBP99_00020 [Azoarcus sp.]|jgi:hypothetical protein|nr:hypothetical protein [Azoarcus sp.]
MTTNKPSISSVPDQVVSSVIDAINKARWADESRQLLNQQKAFAKAFEETAEIREFIGNPSQIIGNQDTKHGEIAEVVEVGIRRARDLLDREIPSATFDGVGRTAPEDFRIDGVNVQSKFYNGAKSSLSGVLDHMEKYKNFGRDGTSIYQIPKDQYEQINRIIDGNRGGVGYKTAQAILVKVQEIEDGTGKKFSEVVRPSVSDYSEVQQGKIVKTIETHEKDFQSRNEAHRKQILKDHEPSLAEGVKATATAAAVGAAVSFASASYKKYQKEGKNIFKGDFTAEDWTEVGGDALTGGGLGSVTGATVYALTNYAELSAPMAGAFVSAVKGMAPLIKDYRSGKINLDQLLDGGMFVCSDAALVGLGAAAGQVLIPVPVLGAVVGSLAGKVLSQIAAGQIKGLQEAIDARMRQAMEKLDAVYQQVMERINAEFEKLGELTQAAFDITRNVQLVQASIDLARAHGVDKSKLLGNYADLDCYMTG